MPGRAILHARPGPQPKDIPMRSHKIGHLFTFAILGTVFVFTTLSVLSPAQGLYA